MQSYVSWYSILLCLFVLFDTFCNCDQLATEASGTCDNSKQGEAGEHCVPSDKNKECKLTPQIFEGPFFVPNQPIRSDIREGRPGLPLKIEFIVRNTNCEPVKGAEVHLWHADALGVYSGYSKYYPLGDPNSEQIQLPHSEPTENETFLRGIQVTNGDGKVQFLTIYPGWYKFRTLHLHFKIILEGKEKYSGEIFFPDELTDQVTKIAPYKQHEGAAQRFRNQQDSQFLQDDGKYLVMKPKGNISSPDGLEGSMEIIIKQ